MTFCVSDDVLTFRRSGSAEPVGGVARFQYLATHYRSGSEYEGQPKLLTFFSGDAYNPSLESSVTKGSHMVPILNQLGTDAACVGVSMQPIFCFNGRALVIKWLLINIGVEP